VGTSKGVPALFLHLAYPNVTKQSQTIVILTALARYLSHVATKHLGDQSNDRQQ
jgi:hypothetical protein